MKMKQMGSVQALAPGPVSDRVPVHPSSTEAGSQHPPDSTMGPEQWRLKVTAKPS